MIPTTRPVNVLELSSKALDALDAAGIGSLEAFAALMKDSIHAMKAPMKVKKELLKAHEIAHQELEAARAASQTAALERLRDAVNQVNQLVRQEPTVMLRWNPFNRRIELFVRL